MEINQICLAYINELLNSTETTNYPGRKIFIFLDMLKKLLQFDTMMIQPIQELVTFENNHAKSINWLHFERIQLSIYRLNLIPNKYSGVLRGLISFCVNSVQTEEPISALTNLWSILSFFSFYPNLKLGSIEGTARFNYMRAIRYIIKNDHHFFMGFNQSNMQRLIDKLAIPGIIEMLKYTGLSLENLINSDDEDLLQLERSFNIKDVDKNTNNYNAYNYRI